MRLDDKLIMTGRLVILMCVAVGALGISAEYTRSRMEGDGYATKYGFVKGDKGVIGGIIFSEIEEWDPNTLLSESGSVMVPQLAINVWVKREEVTNCGLIHVSGPLGEMGITGFGCVNIPVEQYFPRESERPNIPIVPLRKQEREPIT